MGHIMLRDLSGDGGPPSLKEMSNEAGRTEPPAHAEGTVQQVPAAFDPLAGTWTIALGIGAGALVILFIILLICLYRSKCGNKASKMRGDLTLDDISGYTCIGDYKRRASVAEVSGGPPTRKSSVPVNNQLVRSVTVGSIPDFCLPPEKVQPPSSGTQRKSTTALQFQQGLLSGLQLELYRCSDEDDDYDAPPSPAGRIWFALVYDAAVEQLTVTLNKAKYLPGRAKNAPRDPFVKLYLLPDERTCQQSKVRRKTLSPKFNESFVFQVPADNILERILRLSVYDVDKRRVRHSLGHVLLPLAGMDLTKNGEMIWRDLEPVSQASASLGDLNVSLTYVPNLERIKIVVLRARNLCKLDLDPETGVYVKVQHMVGRKLIKSKKTVAQRGTCDPVYNESYSFAVPGRALDSSNFQFTVMCTAPSRFSQDIEYGRVVVGSFMFAHGEDLLHWQEMIAQPRSAVAKWHALAPP
ncbi:synaptotagmin-15 [Lingula anatina]|uniref:Synaptotagmin-15 n=1 Tax=Lingula anatina TaxID=7574 RepID=A0A1S3IU29_LINAN|nr:synaptotagmin-15 [Lingula anatina]|eukprot:XP_013401578.1 synaptotagmin-15 [Lingula anatina]